MQEEKIKFYLNQIEMIIGKKNILNATEVQKCIGMSSATFSRKIKRNELQAIPKFTATSYQRSGKPYFRYESDILTVATFLANKG